MSKATLLEKLKDKEYRDAFVSEEIDVGLPMQLRSMRESRGWKQSEVAEKTATKQPRFSLMEKPGYGKFSLNTLKKIASLFDVGLVVSFVPFSEMIDFVEALSEKRLSIPAFADEYKALVRRCVRTEHRETSSTSGQFSFDFEANTTAATQPVLSAASTVAGRKPVEDTRYLDVPLELVMVASAGTSGGTRSV
jgi:transcriptional regulator with XRE-family HTH domain